MKKLIIVLVTHAVISLSATSLSASLIVLSGDINIANGMDGTAGAGGVFQGNREFFTNVLQGGSSVVMHGDFNGIGSSAHNAINNHYNSLSGVTSTIFAGEVNSSALGGADLFVSMLPSDDFSSSEISAMTNFLANGGSVFFLGDNGFFTTENNRINSALAGLGSSMSLLNTSFDGGFRTATGSQITNHQLTAGVDAAGGLRYAKPTEAVTNGGTALVLGSSMQPFVAVDSFMAVPEPTSLIIWSFIGSVCLISRRRFAH